jgi:hypothetical protein
MRYARAVLGLFVSTASLAVLAGGAGAHPGHGGHHHGDRPSRVLIVVMDQMRPEYVDQFDMDNVRRLQHDGVSYRNAYLGHMASETVVSHNVMVSGQFPKHMGWSDEAYRDAENVLGNGMDQIYVTGDLTQANFDSLVRHANYPKLADY